MTSRNRPSRAASQELTKDALLDAASALVVKHGYGGVSLRDITGLAGFTQGAFYSNFENKESLMLDLMRRNLNQSHFALNALLEESRAEPAVVMQALEEWLVAFFADKTATLQIEMDLHAKRNTAFAKKYEILVDLHKEALTQILERIADVQNARLAMPARAAASALFALTRGLLLDLNKKNGPSPGYILSFFLKACLISKNTNKESR